MRETHSTNVVISMTEGAFREARRTTQLSAPVRERNPDLMGEAPVKYELTGASCHCANRSSRCGVDQLYACSDPLAIG
jgi:hypothetical protein